MKDTWKDVTRRLKQARKSLGLLNEAFYEHTGSCTLVSVLKCMEEIEAVLWSDFHPPKKDKYPFSIKYTGAVKLPKFKYGCQVRCKLLHSYLEAHPDFEGLQVHEPDQFTVESVTKVTGGEIWHLGT